MKLGIFTYNSEIMKKWLYFSSWQRKVPSIVVKKIAEENIVHSLALFPNWFALWTARCDQPQMWLHIPAFGASVISFNSSISQCSGFSPTSFVWMCLSHPLSFCLTTRSLIPGCTCAFFFFFLTELPFWTTANLWILNNLWICMLF